MGLDVRLPIGLMFILLGPILIVTGLLTATPVNWQCGSAMAAFGAVMLALGLRGQARNNRAAAQPQDNPDAEPEGGLH